MSNSSKTAKTAKTAKDSTTDRWLTVLIAGHCPQRMGKNEGLIKSTLGTVCSELCKALEAPGNNTSLRVLTGNDPGTDQLAAKISQEKNWQLQLLVPGVITNDALSSSQFPNLQYAERIVALGSTPEETHANEKDLNQNQQIQQDTLKATSTETLPIAALTTRDDIALTFADLLLVVWDGKDVRDHSDSTVYLLFRALTQRKPIIWIDTVGNVHCVNLYRLTDVYLQRLSAYQIDADLLKSAFIPGVISLTIKDMALFSIAPWKMENISTGSKVIENFDDANEPAILSAASLEKQITDAIDANKESENSGISAFSNEQKIPIWSIRKAGIVDRALRTFFIPTPNNVNKLKNYNIADSYLGPAAPSQYPNDTYPVAPPIDIVENFFKADVDANFNAGKHRSGIWAAYILAAAAVMAAVFGVVFSDETKHAPLPFTIIEFIFLAFIGVVVVRSSYKQYHGNWISRRYLAEQSRYALTGYPLLASGRRLSSTTWGLQPIAGTEHDNRNSFIKVKQVLNQLDNTVLEWFRELARTLKGDTEEPPNTHPDIQSSEPGISINMESWLLQHDYRQQGIPRDKEKGKVYRPVNAVDKNMFKYVENIINGQKNYHKNNVNENEALHARLHMFSYSLFVMTAVAVCAHFVSSEWHFLLIATAAFPAIGAAIHGISSQLEINRIAAQSHWTLSQLQHLGDALTDLKNTFVLTESETGSENTNYRQCTWEQWLRLRKLTIAASEIMSEENHQWAELLKHNDLDLPA